MSDATEKARSMAREIVVPTMDAVARRGDQGATDLVYDLIGRMTSALIAYGREQRNVALEAAAALVDATPTIVLTEVGHFSAPAATAPLANAIRALKEPI